MFHVKRVEIAGFWGKHSIQTDLFPEVNIFIGKNGTGKTTFMNLLQSVLQVDLQSLILLEFSTITIKLSSKPSKIGNKDRVATIKVTRENNPNVSFEEITYRVGTKSYLLRIFNGDVNIRRPLVQHRQFLEQVESLKTEIQKLVKVASLSVHRADYDLTETDNFQRRQTLSKSSIDQRLEQLMQQLTSYRLSLEVKARKESKIFEKDVLVSMLYDEKFDYWDLKDIANVELNKVRSYAVEQIFDKTKE